MKPINVFWIGNGWHHYIPGIRKAVQEATCLPKDIQVNVEIAPRTASGDLDYSKIADADVILPSSSEISDETLKPYTNLKLVFQPAAGYDEIDVQACKRKGIPLCHCPAMNAKSTGEITIMLMLAALRKLPTCMKNVQNQCVGGPSGFLLWEKKVGLVGNGNISTYVRDILEKGFHCQVTSINSKSSREEFEDLLRTSDIVSLHCPLTEKSKGMIGAKELSLMKKSAVLVNAARGGLIVKEDLYDYLVAEKIGFFATDVFWSEPADPCDKFLSLENCLVLPHMASSTFEYEASLGEALARAINCVLVEKNAINLENRLA